MSVAATFVRAVKTRPPIMGIGRQCLLLLFTELRQGRAMVGLYALTDRAGVAANTTAIAFG